MRRLALVVAAVALAAAACAHLQNNETVCPEYRNLRCLSPVDCSMDDTRGCQVCQCRPADQMQADPKLRMPDEP